MTQGQRPKQLESGGNAKFLKTIEKFLFRGMRLALSKEATWDVIPRGKKFSHEEEDFHLEVQYELLQGNNVSGKVLLSLKKVCVWEMSCIGFCNQEDVPLLIRAYRKAYAKDEFFGGRGDIIEYREKGSIKICENRPFAGSFEGFGGTEKVTLIPDGDECIAVRPITSLLKYYGKKRNIKDISPDDRKPIVDLFFDLSERIAQMFLPRPIR